MLQTIRKVKSKCLLSMSGPGVIPCIIKPPKINAIDALPGTPKARVGIKAPPSFALLDVSEAIILFGQFFLYGFTIVYERDSNVGFITGLIPISLLVIFELQSFKANYSINRILKYIYLQMLFNIINNHLESEERQFYLQVAIKLKEKPLVSSEKIPKFFTFFSILLTFIPIISYLFVYS